jgi:azurin
MRVFRVTFSVFGLLFGASGSALFAQAAPTRSGDAVTAPPNAAPPVAAAPSKPAKKPRIVTLKMAEGLRFDPPRLEAQPGELLQIALENADVSHQPHNFVLVKPGQVQEVVKVAMEMGETGPNKGFIPEHPAVLASSGKVVDPDGKIQLTFVSPSEPGVYGYVCSVPGHGMIMYGALYVGVPMPLLAKDPNIPQLTLEKGLVGGGKRPFVQRIFMPNSGPASIAVALPGTVNYCFDAGTCRLRYAWNGPFLDGTRHWRGSGKDLGEVGDSAWWTASKSLIRFGGAKEDDSADVKFFGYILVDGLPEFHYRVGKQEVFELVKPAGSGLEVRYRLPQIRAKVVVVQDPGVILKCSEAVDRKGTMEIPAPKAKEFSVFIQPKDPPPNKDNTAPVSKNSHSHTP